MFIKPSLREVLEMLMCSRPHSVRRQTPKTPQASRVLEYVVDETAQLIDTDTLNKQIIYLYIALFLHFNIHRP